MTTPNHNLNVPATGEYEDAWGPIVNDNFEVIDERMVLRDTIANRPSAGTSGRLFLAEDEEVVYLDDGSSWDAVLGRDLAGDDLVDDGDVLYDASAGHFQNEYVEATQNFSSGDTLSGFPLSLESDTDTTVDAFDYTPQSSAPSHQAGRTALTDGTNWDPDGDTNAELVISDGSSWIEIVDLATSL